MFKLPEIEYRGELYDKFPKIYNIFLVSFVSCIAGLMFGFDISSMSSMIGTDVYKNYFHNPQSLEQGGITASMAGGSFLGSLISPYFTDTFGRRVSLHVCSAFWIVGVILQCASQDVAMLIVGRIIAGLGVGFGSSVGPVYCSEMSPPNIRGAVTGIFQLSDTLGIMILFYIGYGCHFIDGVAAFRITWGIQLVPGVLLLVATFFLPESPRWLASHNRWDEACQVIQKVNGKNPDQVELQLEEMKEQLQAENATDPFQYKDLFGPKTIKKTLVGISAQMWQQLCGINVTMYYVVYIFEMAGFTGSTTLVSGSIQYILNVFMTIVALLVVDKLGRRLLLVTGGVLMCAWMFAIAGILATYSVPQPGGFDGDNTVRIKIPANNKPAANGVIACSYLFVCSFAPTWGVGIWIYCSEIFNNRERAKGAATSTAVNWIFNFSLGLFVPVAFKNITWRTYLIFGVFSAVLTIHTFFMFPETKGKTLEEIDQMWAESIPAWKTGAWVPHQPLQYDQYSNNDSKNEFGSKPTSAFIENESKPDISHIEEADANDAATSRSYSGERDSSSNILFP